MNIVVRVPVMSREQFLDWAARQEAPYEFDGFEPVAMTGGNRGHFPIARNITRHLANALEGSSCEVLPEAGVATVGNAVRYPNVLVTCTDGPDQDRLIADPVIVFEVISPTSGRIDRHVKLREYAAVPSIRRYVLVEYLSPDVTVYARQRVEDGWTASPLTKDEVLMLPEIGVDLPVNAMFERVTFSESGAEA